MIGEMFLWMALSLLMVALSFLLLWAVWAVSVVVTRDCQHKKYQESLDKLLQEADADAEVPAGGNDS